MSRLLTLQNQLKIRAREGRLTDHQLRAFGDIQTAWRHPQRLNLCGPTGAGKTFLAWALAYELDATYFAAPELLAAVPAAEAPAIIDNVDVDAYPLRGLLARLDLYNLHRVLLISRVANPGLLPAVALPAPDEADRTIVLHNLSELEFYSLHPVDSANLWTIIHATL